MATIYDLPLETIGHIFSIAMPVSSCNSEERKERYRFLKAISLVCRSWTPLAQRALWLDVQVLGEEDFDRFLEAGPGRYPVHKLCIDSQTASEESVESILHDVRGVRELTQMSGVTRLEWLFGKNFKGTWMTPFQLDPCSDPTSHRPQDAQARACYPLDLQTLTLTSAALQPHLTRT